ncbi:hypothetical protein ACFL3C_01115 [Patescibacteria group bacterium]
MKKIATITLALSFLLLSGCLSQELSTSDDIVKGNTVRIKGQLSRIPSQHMINIPDGYEHVDYFDFNDGDQIVFYANELVSCNKDDIILTGEIIEIEGTSKRPDSDEPFTELQLLVEKFECDN